MAASNMLIRLVLLIILCLGAFYYCVTTMEQQQRQIAGADGGVGSNWLADPVSSSASTATTSATNSATAASRRNNAPTTATENRSRRLMSGLNSTTTTTSTGSITSLGGSAAGTITGGTVPLLTPNMTAAEVMASLGRSVNNLEQFHHQQLQQLRQQRTVRGSLLNLTSINGTGNEGPNSADSTATTPLTAPSSLTATIISALIRSTATAMALTCGSNQLQSHLTPYSASTTPATLCTDVFSGVATGDKAGFEPEWNQDAEGLPLKKKKDISQDQGDTSSLPTYNKDKQKDLNSFDEDSVYQSEQEFGRFSPTGPTNTSDLAGDEDSWREYRNMMYYSTNYPPPYSTGGGGESSRSNSRRSSVFTPPPSKHSSIFAKRVDSRTITTALDPRFFASSHGAQIEKYLGKTGE
ncbi:hypothetical protein EC991_007967 [Linnemannia zychae]|nr:hypothetical protein EC991_007967 [Linnemannia zychae]